MVKLSFNAGEIVEGTFAPDLEKIRQLATDFDGELRNPHREKPVPAVVRENARHAAVLIPIVLSEIPRVLVTRRQHQIRFGGHICFPGGKVEANEQPIAAAVRESHEEIGLDPDRLEVLGELGVYYTQTGYKITPVVGFVPPEHGCIADPSEVSDIYEISLARVLQSKTYQLEEHGSSAHFAYYEGDVRIGGPTVSIMIGLLELLLAEPNLRRNE